MDLIEKYLGESKKVTKATVKSILKKTGAFDFDGLVFEGSGDPIEIWFDLDNAKQAEKLKNAIVKHLPKATTTGGGNKYLIYWKSTPTDISRINTR